MDDPFVVPVRVPPICINVALGYVTGVFGVPLPVSAWPLLDRPAVLPSPSRWALAEPAVVVAIPHPVAFSWARLAASRGCLPWDRLFR